MAPGYSTDADDMLSVLLVLLSLPLSLLLLSLLSLPLTLDVLLVEDVLLSDVDD
jgi:hypothetical protein